MGEYADYEIEKYIEAFEPEIQSYKGWSISIYQDRDSRQWCAEYFKPKHPGATVKAKKRKAAIAAAKAVVDAIEATPGI
jgi:hypothetical protein